MKYIAVGIITFVLGTSALGFVYYKRLGQDEIYDRKEVANESFKMLITAHKEKGVFLPGVFFKFQSAPNGSDKWQDVLTKKGDEPIPIRPQQLAFVDSRIGYAYIGSYYAVTTDAANNWLIWNGEKELVGDEYQKRYNLSPYIEEVTLQADGVGRMRLYKYFEDKERGPDLVTLDYGAHWRLKE